jgi:hypothetical protein
LTISGAGVQVGMSPFRYRNKRRLGPFQWHFTEHGLSSWGIKIGRWTWNSKRGNSVDLPGKTNWSSR